MSKYGHRPHNWFEGVINKMGGEEQAEAFLRGELVLKPVAPAIFAVWKTITVGGKNKNALLDALQSDGFFVSDWARDMMNKDAFTTSEGEQIINLGRATLRELGFTKEPTTEEIWNRIRELGHDLCQAEDGPNLRLQFTDQERGDWCWLAMEQIVDSDGYPGVFDVRCYDGGKRWLNGDIVEPGDRWDLGDQIVFRLRK